VSYLDLDVTSEGVGKETARAFAADMRYPERSGGSRP
jgi:hypothetical protein